MKDPLELLIDAVKSTHQHTLMTLERLAEAIETVENEDIEEASDTDLDRPEV
jgi:hypothetical protein